MLEGSTALQVRPINHIDRHPCLILCLPLSSPPSLPIPDFPNDPPPLHRLEQPRASKADMDARNFFTRATAAILGNRGRWLLELRSLVSSALHCVVHSEHCTEVLTTPSGWEPRPEATHQNSARARTSSAVNAVRVGAKEGWTPNEPCVLGTTSSKYRSLQTTDLYPKYWSSTCTSTYSI